MELSVNRVDTISVESHKTHSSDKMWVDLHVYDEDGNELITFSLWGNKDKQISVTFGSGQ